MDGTYSDYSIMTKPTVIPTANQTAIRYVYHISDTHIRNIKRHAEYTQVFDRLYEWIKQDSANHKAESIIVLTGDIMHTKTEISPDAYRMAYDLFRNLCSILPLILIAGNHDCIVSNQNRLDALSPIVASGIGLTNLHYLTKSGFYVYNNVVFGLTDIYADSPLERSLLPKRTLKHMTHERKYTIALYHGPIRGSKTDVGYEIKSDRFRAKDFRGYDYGFFGDIHKYQYMDTKKTMAYAGSLIQQSHGETLSNHGVLKWDLQTGASTLTEIPNDYGFCTVSITDGSMAPTRVPPKPYLRFILERTTDAQFEQVKATMALTHSICEIIYEDKATNDSSFGSHTQVSNPIDQGHESFVTKYLQKHITDPAMYRRVTRLHAQIYAKVMADSNLDVNAGGQCWQLLELRFDNAFAYGRNNTFDLSQYAPNEIIGIVAPNHHGKSAILDIILYSLFEKSSRGIARHIMNRNCSEMRCALKFRIGAKTYLIDRTATRGKNDIRMDLTVNFVQVKPNGKTKSLNGVTKIQTNRNIVELIGNYDDYLTSYISTQDQESHGNFMRKTDTKKKEYLYEILKLKVFDECHTYADAKLKKRQAQLKVIEGSSDPLAVSRVQDAIKALATEVKNLQQQLYQHSTLISALDVALSIYSNPELVKYHELADYQIATQAEISHTVAGLQQRLTSDRVPALDAKLKQHHQSILDLKEHTPTTETIDMLRARTQELYQQLRPLPPNYDPNNRRVLAQAVEQARCRVIATEALIVKTSTELTSINTDTKLEPERLAALQTQLAERKVFASHVKATVSLLVGSSKARACLRLQEAWITAYGAWAGTVEALIANQGPSVDRIGLEHVLILAKSDLERFKAQLTCTQTTLESHDANAAHYCSNTQINADIAASKQAVAEMEKARVDAKQQIHKLREQVMTTTCELELSSNTRSHLRLLKLYSDSLLAYEERKQQHQRLVETKAKLNSESTAIQHKLTDLHSALKQQLANLNTLELDACALAKLRCEREVLLTYCSMFNSNGVSYDILKKILPQLEARVNNVLHNMVGFNIRFIYSTDTDADSRQTKTALNAINIHLEYTGRKSYDANQASGFEKFMIGLAVRIVLCHISRSAKPNFFIIDEGWTCFDSENLSNVDSILTFVKNQFEHVIIISHLSELKNQSDHIINICYDGNASRVDNSKSTTV